VVVRPTFEAASQDTVVVVHGQGNGLHVALVTTTLALGDGPGVVESVDRIVVAPDADGLYRVELTVPEAEVQKEGGWNVTVLLPSGARLADGGPVEDPGDDRGFAELDTPAPTRHIAMWWGVTDPLIPIMWTLLR
jgi:hypothetical protein